MKKDQILLAARSADYLQILEEFRQAVHTSAQLATRLYEQGRKDGLPNEEIRKDIVKVLDHIGERQVRRVLPAELKDVYTIDYKRYEKALYALVNGFSLGKSSI